MKKQFILTLFTCLSLLISLPGCSMGKNSSDATPAAVEEIAEPDTAKSEDTDTEEQENTETIISGSKVPSDSKEETSSQDNPVAEPGTNNSLTADTTDPVDNTAPGNNPSANLDAPTESPEILSTEGYVMSVDGNTMYVDLENTGGRTYPGEGEDRKVAFDISNAEQIQTDISEIYPARSNLIRSGIHVDIEYYVQNGINIATKLTSNSQELGPITYLSVGYITAITDSSITVKVTDSDNAGEILDFDLSHCDPISENISIDDLVTITYYIEQDINYAMGVVCIS